MKQVRILKNGRYNGVIYNKGEIWEYYKDNVEGYTIYVKRDNKTTIVCINEDDMTYGKEAEFIEEEPNNLNLIL